MIKFTAVDTDNIYGSAYWGYWGYAEHETFSHLGEGAMRVSWKMHLNNPDDIDGYTPKRIDAESLAKATQDILTGHIRVGSHYREQLARDLDDWREFPQYGVPFDSELSDIIVQGACFGEVIYG